MRQLPLCFLAILALGTPLAAAEIQVPPQAQAVLDQLDKEVAAAKLKAVKAMRIQQGAAAKAGDLERASEMKTMADGLEAEVSAGAAKAASSKAAIAERARALVGVFITPSGSAFTLRSGGTYTSGVLGWSPGGTWALIDEKTVKLTRPDRTEWLFDINGSKLYNRTDKETWRKQ